MYNYCSQPAQSLAANKTTTYSLPAEKAHTLFSPHGYNCTARSLASPAWQIGSLEFDRTWNPSLGTFHEDISFYYNNTAVNSEWPLITGERLCYDETTLGTSLFNGTREFHECSSGPRDFMQFAFNFDTKTLSLTQTWGV